MSPQLQQHQQGALTLTATSIRLAATRLACCLETALHEALVALRVNSILAVDVGQTEAVCATAEL